MADGSLLTGSLVALALSCDKDILPPTRPPYGVTGHQLDEAIRRRL